MASAGCSETQLSLDLLCQLLRDMRGKQMAQKYAAVLIVVMKILLL